MHNRFSHHHTLLTKSEHFSKRLKLLGNVLDLWMGVKHNQLLLSSVVNRDRSLSQSISKPIISAHNFVPRTVWEKGRFLPFWGRSPT
ncbi:hypothetical protein ACQ4M4_18860 [Leptolyngbya sp. AN02str]|uniref:hypothetical protein n=1 Tax=Leptolyngbya sp. AN02str TaxID=3423363 RepID=UPI003D30F81D